MAEYENKLVVIESGSLKKISETDTIILSAATFTQNSIQIKTGSIEMLHGNLTVASGNVEITGNVSIDGSLTLNNTDIGVGTGSITGGTGTFDELYVSGSTTIMGDLTVNGTTTTINSSVITVDDPVFMVNKFNDISNTGSLPTAIGELEGIGFDFWEQAGYSSLITSGSTYLITSTGTYDWASNTFGAPTSPVQNESVFTATATVNLVGGGGAEVRKRVTNGFFGFSNELNAFTVLPGDYDSAGSIVAGSSLLANITAGRITSTAGAKTAQLDGSTVRLYPSGTNDPAVLTFEHVTDTFNIYSDSDTDISLKIGGISILKLDSTTASVVFSKEAGVELPTTSSNVISANRVLCLDSDGNLSHADADVAALQELIGVSLDSSTSDGVLQVHTIFGAKVAIEKATNATGSYTPGTAVYLSTNTGGYITNAAPTAGYVYRAGIVVEDDATFPLILWMPKLVADLG